MLTSNESAISRTHVGHLDGLTGLDRVWLVVWLAVIPALAALVLGIVATSPKRLGS